MEVVAAAAVVEVEAAVVNTQGAVLQQHNRCPENVAAHVEAPAAVIHAPFDTDGG